MGPDLSWFGACVRSGGRRGRATGLIAMVVGLSYFSAVAAGKVYGQRRVPTVLGTAFKHRGTAAAVISDQRYAFAAPVLPNAPGALFDDQDHRRETISRPGCVTAGDAIVSDVLAFDCSNSTVPAPELYVIASRSWRSVAVSSSIAYPCGAGVACDTNSTFTDAGAHWLEFRQNDCPQGEHCSSKNIFENIQTGTVAQDPAVPGGDQLADLDSPRLARRICSPLTIPAGFNIFSAPGPGDVTLAGQFALASSPGPTGGFRTYLERCGTHLHQLIESNNAAQTAGPIAISAHAIVWQQSQPGLDLEFLPSRRRFRLRLPSMANSVVSELALTANHLYVIDQNNKLWITPLPTGPPSSHRR